MDASWLVLLAGCYCSRPTYDIDVLLPEPVLFERSRCREQCVAAAIQPSRLSTWVVSTSLESDILHVLS
jgi:hypothetical protein